MYINQLFPLLPPCFAREIVLLNEQKIARTFSNDKGVSNFAGMENYIMVKQSGRWLNELNSRSSLSVLRKVFQVAKILRLYENASHEQVLQWNITSMKQNILGISQRKNSPMKQDSFSKK